MKNISTSLKPAILFLLMASSAFAQEKKPRARDLGIPFDGTTGKYNAITDVGGVEVGFTTLISGKGKLVEGKGPRRPSREASRVNQRDDDSQWR